MGKEALEQETILKNYLLENHIKYEKEILKKEAIKNGYPEELFDKIFKEISIKKDNTSESSEELKKTKKEGKDFFLVPIEKEKLEKALKESNNVKSFFSPTQIMVYAFCLILLLVSGFGLANSFSFNSLSFDEVDGMGSSFGIGYPLEFISVSMGDEVPFKFSFWNFIIVFILYLLIAYIIDLVLSNSFQAIKSSINRDKIEERVEKKLEDKEQEFKK
jgi:ABC-type antimicrobial peptide transport system permease subunit